ncbi:hypothetical protein LA080_001387 [Diaporthe eres]|uniref:Uncharacterized protein n=1 Tax=Diaporthe vaccinii TaxID=105482 RepID=A0ABR4EUH5_9PEZI|nr:hypothetical protein LA080_001387 [Diaporthe eres]
MGFLANKRSVDVSSHARDAARGLRAAREGARRSNLGTFRSSQALSLGMLSLPLVTEKQGQHPFHHIGKSIEYRAVERRAGPGGTRRNRRSREHQHRKGNVDGALRPGDNTEEAEDNAMSLPQCGLVTHTVEERPVYWKLLQKVLANLGLTEEQWRTMYVGQ